MARRRRPPRPGALTELPPLKIAGQIAALQALYYIGALILVLFTTLVAGTGFSLDLIFSWEAVRGDNTQGWLSAFLWLLDGGFCMSVAIVILIGRSKLVPDFALTIHGLHLVISTFYTGRVPRNAMWWGTMCASSALAITLGIWGCRYRELQPISFGGGASSGSGNNNANGNGEGSSSGGAAHGDGISGDGDEEQGFSRGRGRGRGRDGAGEYEMVKMNGDRVDS